MKSGRVGGPRESTDDSLRNLRTTSYDHQGGILSRCYDTHDLSVSYRCSRNRVLRHAQATRMGGATNTLRSQFHTYISILLVAIKRERGARVLTMKVRVMDHLVIISRRRRTLRLNALCAIINNGQQLLISMTLVTP